MKKKQISFFAYNIIYALVALLIYNFYFWSEIKRTVPTQALCLLFVLAFALFMLMQMLIFWRRTTKVFSILLVIANTLASYFIFSFHIVINKTMLANVIDTNFFEATEWLGVSFWFYLIAFAVIPGWLIFKSDIQFPSVCKRLKAGLVLLLIIGMAAIPLRMHKTEVHIYLKEHFNLRYQLVPTGYTSAIISLGIARFKKVPVLDSEKGLVQKKYWKSDKKNLIVFVLGESVRDRNFGLSGYKRDTTAPLRPYIDDIFHFPATESCGVVTRVSVPCMFSVYDRNSYKEQAIPYTTNALDILHKNGWQMLWLDNELGCNKVCRNILTEYTCTSRDCVDQVLNDELRKKLSTFEKDAFVILHQRGSHGPRYDLRVPPEHRKWSPYCERADYQNCSHEEIINVYDNSIYYTSFLLADLMKTLSDKTDEYNPILIYISDHGESLGEGNNWGHGGDFKTAPKEQTEVPFFVWMPQSTQKAFGFNRACLKGKTKEKKSQDVIFHSLLGLVGITTDTYQPDLDIFSGCHFLPDES